MNRYSDSSILLALASAGMVFILISAGFWALWTYFTLPVMLVYPDGRCADVLGDEYTCGNQPQRYVVEYVSFDYRSMK